MKNTVFCLFFLCFGLAMPAQSQTITIKEGEVFWERTYLKKEYAEILKNKIIDKEKAKLYNAVTQKAALQGSQVHVLVNTISLYDAQNPEQAIDRVYSEVETINNIRWIDGPRVKNEELEKRFDKKDYVVLRYVCYGSFIRTQTGDMPSEGELKKIIEAKDYVKKIKAKIPKLNEGEKEFLLEKIIHKSSENKAFLILEKIISRKDSIEFGLIIRTKETTTDFRVYVASSSKFRDEKVIFKGFSKGDIHNSYKKVEIGTHSQKRCGILIAKHCPFLFLEKYAFDGSNYIQILFKIKDTPLPEYLKIDTNNIIDLTKELKE